MDNIIGTGAQIFSVLGSRFNSYKGLSASALSRAIDLYQKSDYESSIREFKRSIALDPYSDNSLKAYDFLAQAYLKLNRTADAEKVYVEALSLFPTSDSFHLKLANLYYSEGKTDRAEDEYMRAVRLNNSPDNIYPLGQLYLLTGRNREAEDTFLKILSIEPEHYGALYSLGQIYSRQGLYSDALKKFKEVIDIKRDFAYVYYDLGALYADMEEFGPAEEQLRILDGLDSRLAEDLRTYIYRRKKPEIFFVNTFSAFDMTNGPGTPLSSIDPDLALPNSSKDFMIKVYFDKAMDRTSVENVFNWSIRRSDLSTGGGAYNWGLAVPSTEITPPPLPKQVIYNSDEFSATVIFTLRQNAAGDGTIDPSHIVFKFSGIDTYGNKMNPSSDEYVGISIIV